MWLNSAVSCKGNVISKAVIDSNFLVQTEESDPT